MKDSFMRMKRPFELCRFTSQAAVLAAAAVLVVLPNPGAKAAPDSHTLVVCSPGSPGTTDEAKPRMDAFAAAVSVRAATPLTAVYDPSDGGGVARLKTAGIGLVSLPFFLQHEQELGLHPRMQAVAKGRPPLERWALVGPKDRVKSADGLAGFTIASTAAFAPGFVRGTVLGGFGALPATAKLVQSTSVVSSLRRAANGEPTAVLLDATQEASLASLPFAAKLEVIARSPPLPAGLVVTIDARMPARTWSGIEAALRGMASDKASAAALDALQLTGFVALDDKTLTAARKAFADASR
jgi:hypothetical protein